MYVMSVLTFVALFLMHVRRIFHHLPRKGAAYCASLDFCPACFDHVNIGHKHDQEVQITITVDD